MDNITVKEMEVVEELKRRTIGDVSPKMLEDVSLFYRFAKGRDFNIEDAETMLRKHISWRKEWDMDNILTDYKPPQVLVKYVPTTFLGFDKEGSVVRIYDCGRADPKGLWSIATRAALGKYCAFIIEQDIERVIKRGGNLGKPLYATIYDFEKLTYRNAMNLKNIPYIFYNLKMFFDNYPEIIKTLTIINAPFYFSGTYTLIKPILPSVVIQKVRIFGTGGWKDVLSKDTDSDVLPVYLGGNRTDPDGNPLCESLINRGQPIPKNFYMQDRRFSMESDTEKFTVMQNTNKVITFKVKDENSNFSG